MNSPPIVRCEECGRIVEVEHDGRGFPPEIAKRKLTRMCREDGHNPPIVYRAGFTFPDPRAP